MNKVTITEETILPTYPMRGQCVTRREDTLIVRRLDLTDRVIDCVSLQDGMSISISLDEIDSDYTQIVPSGSRIQIDVS